MGVSNRERHSFVGVWDFTTSTLRYIDPSTDQDGAAVWSPDGKSLAFIRSPSQVSDLIFVPERESPIPWSIRVADASTGTSREVWRAKPGKGSVFTVRLPLPDPAKAGAGAAEGGSAAARRGDGLEIGRAHV